MPITPFHFGPGGLAAAAAPRRFSFVAFCAVNVLIDVESAYNMMTGAPRIHTFLHTYLGSTLAAAVVIALYRPAERLLIPWMVREGWPLRPASRPAIVAGTLAGAWSHVVLDSIMHGDIRPWAPWSMDNGLYHVLSMPMLHGLCLGAGLAALAGWAVRRTAGQGG